jgi:hypothetical protein
MANIRDPNDPDSTQTAVKLRETAEPTEIIEDEESEIDGSFMSVIKALDKELTDREYRAGISELVGHIDNDNDTEIAIDFEQEKATKEPRELEEAANDFRVERSEESKMNDETTPLLPSSDGKNVAENFCRSK